MPKVGWSAALHFTSGIKVGSFSSGHPAERQKENLEKCYYHCYSCEGQRWEGGGGGGGEWGWEGGL